MYIPSKLRSALKPRNKSVFNVSALNFDIQLL